MNTVLIANIISFIGASIMVLVGFIKTRRGIFAAQTAMFGILGVSNLMLGGFSGFISNILSIIRNIFGLKNQLTLWVKIIFCVLQTVIVGLTNSEGWLGWLPVIAAIMYTWFMDTGNEKQLKLVIIIGELIWIVYDLLHRNYSAAAFDVFATVSNVIGIVMLNKAASKKAAAAAKSTISEKSERSERSEKKA